MRTSRKQRLVGPSIRISLPSDTHVGTRDDLAEHIRKDLPNVRVGPGLEQLPAPILYLTMIPGAAYIGHKLIDLVVQQVQGWLDSRKDVPSVEIFGPDGEVVKVVKRAVTT